MAFDIIQITALLLLAILIASMVKARNLLHIAVIILFSLLINFEISSLIFGGSLIDYKFYSHLQFNKLFLTKNFFVKESIGLLLSFALMVFIIYWSSNAISKSYSHLKKWIRLALIPLIGFLGIKDAVFNKLFMIGKLHFAS